MVRKLASIRKISDIQPIAGADKICAYVVDGWMVVDSVGKYKIDELVVMCEIDSWIPHKLAPFLSKGKEPREFEGVKGERLRTIKLRGQLSQGLLIPMEKKMDGGYLLPVTRRCHIQEDEDVTEELGIKKWEKPIPAQLAGVCKGNFPTAIPKTDQERCQNLKKKIAQACADGAQFEITEKLEGSSMTCYLIDGEFGVCSRNLDLKETAENAFWKTARAEGIEEKMRGIFEDKDVAIQGELVGPGIQGNIYGLKEPTFYVFDVYSINKGAYLLPEVRRNLINGIGLKNVPIIAIDKDLGCGTVEELLEWAEDKSRLNDKVEREGIVFKEVNGSMTFKAISNLYLINEK